jgi:pimeloyl-ACP methyl ester carboxylesterase
MLLRFLRGRRKLWGLGLGAGVLGTFAVVLSHRTRRVRDAAPEMLPPAIFATRVSYTSRGQLVYHESGSGDILLFIHHLYAGASSYEWSKVYPHFATDYKVLALDLLGFGESERPAREFNSADHVQTLTEFIRAKSDGKRVTLIASGQGAAFAVLLTAQHPELVQRLILLTPSGSVENQLPSKQARWLLKLPLFNRLVYRQYVSRGLRKSLTQFGFVNPNKVTTEIVDALTHRAQQFGAERAIFLWARKKFEVDIECRLSELTQPVTIVWGEKAIHPPVTLAHRLQAVGKKTNLILLEQLSVFAALEDPQQVIELLSQELDSTLRVL